MKTKSILLCFCFLTLLSQEEAQSVLKHFLPHNNAAMSISDHKYWFEGDTLIENKRYTKVYRQCCISETDCRDLQYYAAVREDTVAEKIYCLQTMDSVERLLVDFNVREGDWVTLYSYTKSLNWSIDKGYEHLEVIEKIYK